MSIDILHPQIDLLSKEYVLVQAWKKTASYIRYHNWYSDTLELDRAAVNLPRFLSDLAERFKAPSEWTNDPLRIVPAPKSQHWHLTKGTKRWEPRKSQAKLRPLAYASLRDQVAATAVMLCLADRVETIQGDPRGAIRAEGAQNGVVSYGNRLFCDNVGGQLRHRWGSGKLYRNYFEDYKRFLLRPDMVADAIPIRKGSRILIVHSDLSQFYDRVRPSLLAQKVNRLAEPKDDSQFYALARRLLRWKWHRQDYAEVAAYQQRAGVFDFSSVALPQGLVASGFFANIVLLDFDEALKRLQSREIKPGIRVEDVCRYVDDLRIVVRINSRANLLHLDELKPIIGDWLQNLLDRHAKNLKISEDKTAIAGVRDEEHPVVSQSRRMESIQRAISGGFDAVRGEEILNSVQGLIRSQQRYSERSAEDVSWSFSPIPDVRDETVARFAAARFRSTFRSLRPLLDDPGEHSSSGKPATNTSRSVRTRADLDQEAKTFALGLIENWINDPSNVRLLRIGLDLWPDQDVLESVLNLLRPYTGKAGHSRPARQVAWYCLAEIFRAGATETGFVEHSESLPNEINIGNYRDRLLAEALRLSSMPTSRVPWYVMQQVLLFIAVNDTKRLRKSRNRSDPATRHYQQMISFLTSKTDNLPDEEIVTLAVLARRSFRGRRTAVRLAHRHLRDRNLDRIAELDPSFALEIIESKRAFSEKLSPRTANDLCMVWERRPKGLTRLSSVVLKNYPTNPLRNELTLLSFASAFLSKLVRQRSRGAITPSHIFIKLAKLSRTITLVSEVQIIDEPDSNGGSMYSPPQWASTNEHWRFQLGFLLRFILSARQDFTQVVRPTSWRETSPDYRPSSSHWYQRLYGLYNGHSAFGDDWLPISDWTELLLLDLLRWPGCPTSGVIEIGDNGIRRTKARIRGRIRDLLRKQGSQKSVFMIPLIAPRPEKSSAVRPLRACVVQTVIPDIPDFVSTDLTLSKPTIRGQHRNHLSAALAAVERMLILRETHLKRDDRLDWLILPELSVHPRDVNTHLVPFARKHKTIILAGLTYEALFKGRPLVNSALWVIPDWSATHGLQILIRRQGKQHLAALEQKLNVNKQVVEGFRPCQWLVGYDWQGGADRPPLWLTGAVCYDATDISLVADLGKCSDVFAIPSLNKDVRTFDQMALALHYHMFQMVIVANNGIYGGSNAYAPYQHAHVQQVFHLHGQPQASIAFLEIDDIEAFIDRKARAKSPKLPSTKASGTAMNWKYPPAGI